MYLLSLRRLMWSYKPGEDKILGKHGGYEKSGGGGYTTSGWCTFSYRTR